MQTPLSLSSVEVSVVIPVYNEEGGLQALFDRVYPALDSLGESYEIIFVNDGSATARRRCWPRSSTSART
jgi:undecaprenyl-phosphate 4-deoxy-4-formamido-L-arabinose transferase